MTFILSFPFLMNILFLYNSGELLSVDDIVTKQMSSETLYASALSQNTFQYKLKLVEKVKPEVITLGSSRVMAFRKELFNTSFVNTGGAVNCIPEAETFVDAMLKIHKPKVILFGLDDWWFNDKSSSSIWENPNTDNTQTITADKLLFPFEQMYLGKITLSDYVHILLNINQNYSSKILESNLIGVTAIIKEGGFRSDGSIFYGDVVTSKNEHDFKFKNVRNRIAKGIDRFEYSKELSQDKWDRFEALVKKLKSEGIEVIVFLPPYSQTAYQEVLRKQDQYVHFIEISKRIKNTEIYDFRNPQTLNLTDCDFIDGIHGSEMVYLKLLSALDNRQLQNFIQKDFILKYSNDEYSQKVCIPIGFTSNFKEKDFLGIGCKR